VTILQPTDETIQQAAEQLARGDVVAFSTETVYGLGCDTFNDLAIKKVYKLKNRPTNNPTIAHVLEKDWTERLCVGWNNLCDLLATNFWPGALTLVLPKKDTVPTLACGGFDTIAIRCPSHPVARKLLSEFKGPISAPSANKSGHVSPTTAKHVEEEFGGGVLVVDGGPCERGIESTIISMVEHPTVLRFGSVSIKEIESIIGAVDTKQSFYQTNSPGTSPKHYAPRTKTLLVDEKQAVDLCDNESILVSIQAKPLEAKMVFKMPNNPREYAKQLYSTLREADKLLGNKILIERPPINQDWQAINDRLVRCSTD
jgi:L-threonylcarbamoyladenylate synthase